MGGIKCIRCGALMDQRSCKVRCGRCGLFYDCSDGMLPLPEGEGRLPRPGDPGTATGTRAGASTRREPRG